MIEWLLDNLATILIGLFGAGGWLGYLVNNIIRARKIVYKLTKSLKPKMRS